MTKWLGCLQLFRERLSEKVHAIIPKGIVSGFEFTVLSKKFERMAALANICPWPLVKESKKSRFDSYSVRNSVLLISHITFRDCRVHIFSDNLSRNSCLLDKTLHGLPQHHQILLARICLEDREVSAPKWPRITIQFSQRNISYTRCLKKCFTQTYRDLGAIHT